MKPSTIPLESCLLARNQFKSSSRCERTMRAIWFIGSSRERIVRVHHRSRNRPAHYGERYTHSAWKSSLSSQAHTVGF